ncbi:hypothetical protein [Lichenibacterium dinghuense]|uniref:hypothetical protein n=1 Tax=Lichenibacterium dinghuense TaxID=2895977 RepID=UPI001F490B26|nr:hypothetical protein [Lichenibacterium sp. 6Y81]
MTTIDLERVRKATAQIKASPPASDDALNDPKAFLARQGIPIDDAIATMIASRRGTITAPRQASAIHIDIGAPASA